MTEGAEKERGSARLSLSMEGTMSEPDRSSLGWAAGAIDGEGCIGIYQTGVERMPRLRVMVKNTDPRMPLRLKALFGGNVNGRFPGGKRRKVFTWSISGRPAAKIIAAVYPYLIIKREQAEIAAAYAKTLGKTRLSEHDLSERHRFEVELKAAKAADLSRFN